MVTKSRNSFLNSIIFSLAILLLGYSVLATANIVIFYDYVKSDSYFKTNNFVSRLVRSAEDLTEYYVTFGFKNYEEKAPEQRVTVEEVNRALEENKSYINESVEKIKHEYEFQINELSRVKAEQDKVIAERDKRVADFIKENQKTAEDTRKELLKSRDSIYSNLKTNIQQWKSIKYYINNKKTGEIYTNLQPNINIDEYISRGVLYQDKFPKKISSKDERMLNVINKDFLENNLEGYIIVPVETDNYSDVYWESVDFQNNRNRLLSEGTAGAAAFIVSLVLFIFINRRREQEETILDNLTGFYIRIPLEIRLVTLLVGSIGYLAMLSSVIIEMLELPMPGYILLSIASSIYMLFILLHIRGFYHIIISNEVFINQWRGTLFYRTMSFIYESFINRSTTVKVTLTNMASFFFAISIIVIIVGSNGVAMLLALMYFIGYIVLVPFNVLKEAIYLNQVVQGSEEIVSGNFNYVIEEKGNPNGILRKLAHNFNNIKGGLKKSLESQMKSERLKSELITNVSHDLKTPLTSIINYVDLLKDKELSEEEREGYIEILDRKSQRLKVLIEDLFEASKMASGSAELIREKVDIVAMLRQTLGEFDEKINNSNLTFKINIPSEKVYLNLDGKKTWRVFENIINNALKYSQPSTRVYIDLIEVDTSVKIIVRNIANYEMDFDVEEIFERFKRGDKSRNTEGSGLGLAIAKSIVEMQDGNMNIEIDRDLFKVTIQFNK